jgi:hypothetical protein
VIPEPDDFSDEHWLDEHGEFVLAFHDPGCVAEAIQDAFNHGVDDEAGARCAAAQLLEGGDIPCRCAPSAP